MKTIKFQLTFIDGSEAIWDSGLSELKSAIATFRAQPDYNIDGVHMTKHSVLSWEIVK